MSINCMKVAIICMFIGYYIVLRALKSFHSRVSIAHSILYCAKSLTIRTNRNCTYCLEIRALVESIRFKGRLVANPFTFQFAVCERRNNLYGGTGARGLGSPRPDSKFACRYKQIDASRFRANPLFSPSYLLSHFRRPVRWINKYIRRCEVGYTVK